MMLRRLLLLAISTLLWEWTVTDSQLKNLVSPIVDFSNNQLGMLSITFHWQAMFNPIVAMPNLKAKITFPFALTAPLTVDWVAINDACIVSTNMNTATSYASAIAGDPTGAHFFDLIEANYITGSKYKMIVKITNSADIPTTTGNQDPIKFELVSADTKDYITYGYNNNFGYLRITSPAISNFQFELTPSFTDTNLKEFTRDFSGKADVRIVDVPVSRILIKLDNYVFSDDAESTCSTEPDDALGIKLISRADFYCEFENTKKKGLYFIWQDGKTAPIDETFRIKFRIKNPDVPGSTSMTVSMYERYSPYVLKFKNVPNAFSCGPTSFSSIYPKLYLGPNLDASSEFFPNLTLFSKGNKASTITYNSIRLEFKANLDLPKPATSYTLFIKINGNAQTTVPVSLIYHDLPAASGYSSVKISVDAATADIKLEYIGELSTRSLYTIGFKVGFMGTETIPFIGDQSFCAMWIETSTGVLVVNKKAPPNLNSRLKSVATPVATNHQTVTALNVLTYIHTRNVGEANGNYQYSYINNAVNKAYGMRIGSGKELMLSYEGLTTLYSGTVTPSQTYVELIASQYIQATPIAGTWDNANAATNCFIRKASNGALVASSLASCKVILLNKGLAGSEYTRLRMGGSTPNNFYGTAGTYTGGFIWGGVTIGKMSSLFKDGSDAAVLDFYVNAYSDAFTTNIDNAFLRGLEFTSLINGYVINPSHLTSTTTHFINYIRTATISLDGTTVPSILRVSGLLNQVDAFKVRKLVIFFQELTALPIDPSIPYEVGCNTAAKADVKCYFYKGVDNAPCAAGTCTNFMSQNRLEILMSTTIGSISDVYQIHIAVPIVVPVGTTHTYTFQMGTASQYDGSLSSFADMLQVNNFLPSFKACDGAAAYCPNAIPTTTGTIATNKYIQIKSLLASVGSSMDSVFEYNCAGAAAGTPCNINLIGQDFFSLTYCAEWNFMNQASFSVTSGSNVYEQCVPGITYKYVISGTTYQKYCLYCPQWSSGTTTSSLPVLTFKNPSAYGLNIHPRTYAAISGTQSTGATARYGLYSLVDQTAISPFMSYNSISSITSNPSTIYYDSSIGNSGANSISITFSMLLSNQVAEGGWIVFSSASNLPFTWLNSPATSTYCNLQPLNIGCTVTISSASQFRIQVPTGKTLTAGLLQVTIGGIQTVRILGSAFPHTHNLEIYTYTSAGVAANNMIDRYDTFLALTLDQYMENSVPAALNILKLTNMKLAENVKNYRTEISIDVYLGNGKYFMASDVLKIDLRGGAGTVQEVYCQVLEIGTGKVLPEFSNCLASGTDLSGILVSTTSDTVYNNFTVVIQNYIVITASAAALTPLGSVYFKGNPAIIIQQQAVGDTEPAWPATVAYSLGQMTLATVAKKINYFGFRVDFTFSLTPQAVTISYETRVYIQFPMPYNSGFGSFPISCYQATTGDPIKLYCWKYRDRTLAITGFRTDVPAGTAVTILVYGVQQPLHSASNSEVFYLAIDTDADPSMINEYRFFTYSTASSSIATSVKRFDVIRSEYSHKYIRALNSILFVINSPIAIPGGSYIYVYIDHLEFEYDIAGFTAICSVKTDQAATNLVQACLRQGNRYRMELGTTGLTANVNYTLLIEGVPTPDFYSCKVKRPELMIVGSALNLLAISTDIFQNTEVVSFIADESYTYFTFDGMTSENPLQFKKGIFNDIKIKRSDSERFNDDFNFTLGYTENGIFSQLDPSNIRVEHSHFGLATLPVYLASTLNSFTNQIIVTVNFTARFRNSIFAKLPLLRAQLTDKLTTLVAPTSLNIWVGKGSLPFYVELRELPITDITFAITFTGTTSLTANPSTFTLGQATRKVKVKISSSHASLVAETPILVITPSVTSGYGPTSIPITLNNVPTTSVTINNITISEAKSYGFSVDVLSPKPISFYTITMPQAIFRTFTKSYIVNKFDNNMRTDEKYYIDYTISQGVEVLNLEVNSKELRSKENYVTIFYIEDIDGGTDTKIINFTTADSPGGYGYVNLTFASSVTDSSKPMLMCHLAQIFAYPLENLQTSDGFKCPSTYKNNSVSSVELDPATLPTRILAQSTEDHDHRRRLQLTIIDKTNSLVTSSTSSSDANLVQVYFLKNRREMYDTGTYAKVQSVVIKDSFYTILGDKLKDYPQVTLKTPLISLQFFSQTLERQSKIYNIKDMTKVQVTELKISKSGYLHCMILNRDDPTAANIIGLHVKYGINARNETAIWKKSYLIEDPNWVIYFNIDDLPIAGNEANYTFYYYATDKRVDELAGTTSVNKIDFRIYKVEQQTLGKIVRLGLALLILTMAMLLM